MEVGTTVHVEIDECRDGYLKAERDGNRFSIAGEGSVGDKRDVRVVEERRGTFIAVTESAELKLKIDEVVDGSTVRADPPYGPVFIEASLSRDDLWQCEVTDVQDDRIVAKHQKKIPRNSEIPEGELPEDPTQSLNDLLSGRKL